MCAVADGTGCVHGVFGPCKAVCRYVPCCFGPSSWSCFHGNEWEITRDVARSKTNQPRNGPSKPNGGNRGQAARPFQHTQSANQQTRLNMSALARVTRLNY
jgi:hypothetical protein